MMLAPWVLLPTILALRACGNRSVRALAAQAGLAVALMGAVNAIATLAGCLPAVIWWACHRPNRLWWRYTAWWLLALALATLWWVVALVLLRHVSPPFLDFIESSGVTTQWSSLTEMLRGTDSWTPFVAPTATAGAPLVTGSAAILGTCLVAAAGLAGLASPGMPARGRLVTMLLVGVVLMAAGYSGGLGSPVAHQVQAFLDAGGAPLRNVHKLGVGDPDPAGAGHRAAARPDTATGQRAGVGVAARVRPPRARQAGRGDGCGPDGADGQHLAGVDRAAHPAGHVQRDTPVLARGRRLAHRAQHRDARCRTGAGGPGGAVRHAGVGHQP